MVTWIIGLSGAGKTTLAMKVTSLLRSQNQSVILIDGDVIRDMFRNDLGHSMEDRSKNADRICRLCKFLDDQGVHVVCAILSLFSESRTWNRDNIENYYEVFIDSSMQNLVERDSKGIYKRFNDGEITNVAGMDIEFQRPADPDLTIENIGSVTDLLGHAKPIADKILSQNRNKDLSQ